MLGELKIFALNIPQDSTITFETKKVASTLHWDFQNNLVTNNDYTYQSFTLTNANSYDAFWFRNGYTSGMGKGMYEVKAKKSNGTIIASFFYDLRTCIDYNNSPDLEVEFNYSASSFKLKKSGIFVTNGLVNSWDYTNNMCCEQEVNLFEPTAPNNLSVYNYCGYPFVTWNNNNSSDYYTNVDVYRCFTYMNEPDSFTKIAELSANASNYYDSNFRVGDYGSYKVFYKVCKRNNQKNSQFSNYASIGAVPRYKIGEGNNLAEKQSTEDESKNRDILYQNFPNPFNPMTELSFELKEPSKIKLEVLDILGRVIEEIVYGNYAKGKHNIKFAVRNLPSGIYFYRLNTGDNIFTKKNDYFEVGKS